MLDISFSRLQDGQVSSLSNGGSLHFPWATEESMMTCTLEACTGAAAQWIRKESLLRR